jgi:drug/metabolite transporter (DMT)-like permease
MGGTLRSKVFKGDEPLMVISLAAVGMYVLLVGVASFLERPVGSGFDALQLNALIRMGSAALGIAALLATHGISLPAPPSLLAGLGIGVLAGSGSICYCLALNYLPVSVVVSLANLYIVITVLLGVAILHENVTLLKVAALVLTVTGALLLTQAPVKHGIHVSGDAIQQTHRLWAFGILGLYVTLVGVSTFLEKPALRGLDATQLNALLAIGMLVVAGVALATHRHPPKPGRRMAGSIGVGAMIGLGSIFYFLGLTRLPVSVAVGASNAYIVVTVLLSVLVAHDVLSWSKRLAVALTVVGVTLFALSAT